MRSLFEDEGYTLKVLNLIKQLPATRPELDSKQAKKWTELRGWLRDVDSKVSQKWEAHKPQVSPLCVRHSFLQYDEEAPVLRRSVSEPKVMDL